MPAQLDVLLPTSTCRRLLGICSLMLGFLVAGCSFQESVAVYQPTTDIVQEVTEPLGQTLFLKSAGWRALEVWVEGDGITKTVPVLLFTHPDREQLAAIEWEVSAFEGGRWVRIPWPRTLESLHRSYYVVFQPPKKGVLRLGTGPAHTYVDGSLYESGLPVNGQLAVKPVFSRPAIILRRGLWLFSHLGLVLVSFLVFAVPGWGLVAWFRRSDPVNPLHHWTGRLCTALGLSVAIYPLLFVWFDLLGLHPGTGIAWIAIGLGLVLLAWRTLSLWRSPGPEGLPPLAPLQMHAPVDWAFVIVLAGLLISRFGGIGAVQAPLWGDSVQHAFIAQLMLDRGGLFDSWQPYADFLSFTNHFGFHANVAALGFLLNFTGIEAAMLGGQLLNVIAILVLYPITVFVAGGNRWAGVTALLVGGLLSSMPAMYVNWGRYAQLSGQAVLPVAVLLLWLLANMRHFHFRSAGITALALGGMALCYYRMPLFYAAFALLLLLVWILPNWGWDGARWRQGLSNLLGAAGMSVILIFPQFVRLWGSILVGRASVSLGGAPQDWVWQDYQIWRSLPDYYPRWLQQWAGWAWIGALIVAHRKAFLIGLWGVSLGGLVALSLLRVPLMSELQNFAVVIAMYIPFSILAGWLVGWLAQWLMVHAGTAWERNIPRLGVLASLLVTILAMPTTRDILDEQFNMVSPADVHAMAWIRENTDRDAKFLVPGFRVYGGRTVVGADAGWWIPLLTQRKNSMPPQYALLEKPLRDEQVEEWVSLVASLEGIPLSASQAIRLLCEQGYTHVYLGQKQGAVGFEVRQLYTAGQLAQNPHLRPVYRQDRVRIHAVDQAYCLTYTQDDETVRDRKPR